MNKKKYHRVLTIAGSDSSGGAGIQADLKTISALGCYGMSVITALTAQNTKGVKAIHAVPPAFVGEQLEAVYSDIGADATKIGMLYSAELIEIIGQELRKYSAQNIVIDPVMVSQSGRELLEKNGVSALKRALMPLATVFTPNLPEASALLNRKIHGRNELKQAAIELASYGPKSILVKGGHLADEYSSDLFYISPENRFITIKGEHIDTINNHGTGCTLSSAIACFLAKGLVLEEAVRAAKEYISGAIRAGAQYEIGNGHGPVHHFYEFW